MITQRDLVDRLAARRLAAWTVAERVQDLASADEARGLERRHHRTRLAVIVHQDSPRGRGTARLDLDPFDGSPDDAIDQLIALAAASVGPAWSTTPPAAPAKVSLLDDDLVKRQLDAVARNTLLQLHRPPGLTVTARADVLREAVTVVASSGFHTSWLASQLHVRAVIALGPTAPSALAPAGTARPATTTGPDRPPSLTGPDRPPSLTITRSARRVDDLALDPALADAAADLGYLAVAGPPTAGPCALWLGPDALLHGDDLGLWAVFAHQADAAVERQGLTRYRLRAPISPGAAQQPEPLTIHSDGALDFATRSSPVTDDAVAIRRFPLVERGLAVGLGLSRREAALRRTDPNGGVRNLVVEPGTWPVVPGATGRTIEVRRLHAVAIDPYTGDASLDIALGLDHRPGRADPIPFTGGTLRLDLISALARARRAGQRIRRAAYHGPTAVLIDDAELLP